MTGYSQRTQILIIESQQYWRDFYVDTLEQAGYRVNDLADYTPEVVLKNLADHRPSLIIVGCVQADKVVNHLVDTLITMDHHLLVLCSSLPQRVMRNLFVAGAQDVTEKLSNPKQLIKTVDQIIKMIAKPDSYREIKQKGTSTP